VAKPHLRTTEALDSERASQGAPRRRHLLVVTGAGSFAFALPIQGAITVGRADECELRVDDAKLSRRHAIVRVGEIVEVMDLGSSNGTRIGAKKLDANAPVAIAVGESVTIGSTLLVLRETSADDPAYASSARRGTLAELLPTLKRIAEGTINALVLGETGVGKEVVARRIHELSPRAKSPMICVNCAALTETLLESELFGYERGAFTGAVQSKPGLLEAAEDGTIFLDEIGEMPLAVQAKLLRVLEQREVLRLGALKPRPIRARFIAATNRDLEADCERGMFRKDLYFRLNGISIAVPPLRERRGEIEPLARAFVAEACAQSGRKAVPALAPDAIEQLRAYEWPGNIRELKNVVERAVLLCTSDAIAPEHLPDNVRRGAKPNTADMPVPSTDDERARIIAALEKHAGNQTQAAKLLGVSLRTLVNRIEAYGIPRPRKR
jgi:DNA-binding NtrC family response regulator